MEISWEWVEISPSAFHLWDIAVKFDESLGIDLPGVWKMYKLVLLRHGQSQWNLENRFTGWTDVDLTEQGKQEAETAGKL